MPGPVLDRGQVNQRDEYFDTREENLKEQDFTVRLRSVNGNLKVALKGPRIYLPSNIYLWRNRSRGRNLLIYYGSKQPKFRNFGILPVHCRLTY
jgi:adenylate cyclase class IV